MTSSARLFDKENKIIEIVWYQNAQPQDFDRVNSEIEKLSRDLGGAFDVLVDMREVQAFSPDSQVKLVEHQKSILGFGMQRAAVVVTGAISKLQLTRSARQSEHTTESHWNNYDEAVAYLKAST